MILASENNPEFMYQLDIFRSENNKTYPRFEHLGPVVQN